MGKDLQATITAESVVFKADSLWKNVSDCVHLINTGLCGETDPRRKPQTRLNGGSKNGNGLRAAVLDAQHPAKRPPWRRCFDVQTRAQTRRKLLIAR